jgi:hypothetical protein
LFGFGLRGTLEVVLQRVCVHLPNKNPAGSAEIAGPAQASARDSQSKRGARPALVKITFRAASSSGVTTILSVHHLRA